MITPEPFQENSYGKIGLTSSRVLQRLMAGVMNGTGTGIGIFKVKAGRGPRFLGKGTGTRFLSKGGTRLWF